MLGYGMEIHENFIPHDSLDSTVIPHVTGESMYYTLASSNDSNRNNNQCNTTNQTGNNHQNDVDSTKPKYDDSINIIVEEPDGVRKRCRVQRITYKNFLSVCEEVTKLEHKIPSLPQPPPTPMSTTKPIFNSPATSPQQSQQSFLAKNAPPNMPTVAPVAPPAPPRTPQAATKQEPSSTLDSVFPNGQNASYSSLQSGLFKDNTILTGRYKLFSMNSD